MRATQLQQTGLRLGQIAHTPARLFVCVLLFGTSYAQVPPSTANSAITSTLAGGGNGFIDGIGTAASFKAPGPTDVALSPCGTFALVPDSANNAIRRIDVETGTVTTLAGHYSGCLGGCVGYVDGPATRAKFHQPLHICIANHGRVAFVIDQTTGSLPVLRRIDIGLDRATTMVSTLVGGGPGSDSKDGNYCKHGAFELLWRSSHPVLSPTASALVEVLSICSSLHSQPLAHLRPCPSQMRLRSSRLPGAARRRRTARWSTCSRGEYQGTEGVGG